MTLRKRLSIVVLGLTACGIGAAALAQDSGKPAAEAKPADAKSAKPALPAIYDEQADAKAQIAAAVARAKRENQRVLVMFGANWCSWCHKLHGLFKSDKEIAHQLSYEYQLVLVDVSGPDGKGFGRNLDLAKELGADLKKNGIPFLCVLDGNGKPLAAQESGVLEDGDHHSPDKVRDFLKKFEAEPRAAAKVLEAGLAEAKKTGKPAFVHLSAPWCGWCKRLDALLHGPELASIFEPAVIDVEIDLDRMPGAKEVQERLRKNAAGGIPWFAFVDGDGKVLGVSEIDGKNIGFPTEPAEIEHITGLLKAHAKTITPAQLEKVSATLKEAAAKLEAQRKAATEKQ